MSVYTEAEQRVKDNIETRHFRSRFKHLQSHNGFRPGELHTFIAEKGGGKSTLMRAWIIDCLLDGKKVFLRLSEEKSQVYRDSIILGMGHDAEKYIDNLIIDSENELSRSVLGEHYMDELTKKIIVKAPDIFVLDNFTTSVLSRANPAKQEEFASDLRQIAMDQNIAVIVAAHTEKGFNKKRGIVTGDNIRGNMTLSNTAAYIYTLTIFHDLPEKPSLLLIDKARYHSQANKKLFLLEYMNDTYRSDKPVTYDLMKLILKDSQR